MVYIGEVLTGEGLEGSKKRVEAIFDAPRPQNKSEVRFLGSAQFCAKFISFQPFHASYGISFAWASPGVGAVLKEKALEQIQN